MAKVDSTGRPRPPANESRKNHAARTPRFASHWPLPSASLASSWPGKASAATAGGSNLFPANLPASPPPRKCHRPSAFFILCLASCSLESLPCSSGSALSIPLPPHATQNPGTDRRPTGSRLRIGSPERLSPPIQASPVPGRGHPEWRGWRRFQNLPGTPGQKSHCRFAGARVNFPP